MRYAAYLALMGAVISVTGCGKSESTPREARDFCEYDGRSYDDGSSFDASDGCNQCSCEDGSVACTQIACQPTCEELAESYGQLIDELKACDPAAERPCSYSFTEGLACGCATFGTSAASAAAAEALTLQQQYSAQGCGAGVQCGQCDEPIAAHCTDAGRCEDDTAGALSPVAECEQFCEALAYRLPGALCEDWNRPGWEPAFCNVSGRLSCADYCGNVYETVSPACADTLPPVIRCVAPTYASVAPPSLGECWLEDCRDQLYTMTSACYGLREKLTSARATWAASGVSDYQLQYDWNGAKAEVTVRVGSEPVVTPPDAVAWTVLKLFDEVERYLDTPGVAPGVTYHPVLGYALELTRQQGCADPADGVFGIEVAPVR